MDDSTLSLALVFLLKLKAEWDLNPDERTDKHYAQLCDLIERVKEQCAEYKWFNEQA